MKLDLLVTENELEIREAEGTATQMMAAICIITKGIAEAFATDGGPAQPVFCASVAACLQNFLVTHPEQLEPQLETQEVSE